MEWLSAKLNSLVELGGGGGNQLHLHKNKRICKITPFLLTMVLSEMKIDYAPQTVYNSEPS
jgi:hypothetical protein